jgi:uncharacterized FAD-dependent dehydrogenase
VAATSEPGRVVTNGMSQYSRSEFNANAGIVVGITPDDYPDGPLAGIEFQRRWESLAFIAGGEDYHAPGQLVGDFLEGRASTHHGDVMPSYQPGVRMSDLRSCLPEYVIEAMLEALPVFDRRIPGFTMADAILTGVETRTSSPLRITRGPDFRKHQHERIVSRWRRRRLRGRNPFRGDRRNQGRGSDWHLAGG